jgi:CRISPR/Cas system CMR-associated protein Cmr5 small subunit
MPPVSLEQVRAQRAYTAPVSPMAESLPTMLQVNGLLATWAFLISKKEESLLHTLAMHLMPHSDHALQPRAIFLRWVGSGAGRLTASELRRLTDEALAFSAWLKRAAQAKGGE